MEERKRVYTPEEIAEILQITEYTVLKWLREGRLEGFKAGRLWRISEESLQEFISRDRRESAARMLEQLKEDHKND